MKRPKERRKTDKQSPETIPGEEALKRMKSFGDRKENFIAAIKKSKDRDLSARAR